MENKSDIEIARAAKKENIVNIAKKMGISENYIIPYGYDKAKISSNFISDFSTVSTQPSQVIPSI